MRSDTYRMYHSGQNTVAFTVARGGTILATSHVMRHGVSMTGWGVATIGTNANDIDQNRTNQVTEMVSGIISVLSWSTASGIQPTFFQSGIKFKIDDNQRLFSIVGFQSGTVADSIVSISLFFDDTPPEGRPEEDPLGPLTGIRGRRRSSLLESPRGLPLARESFLDDRKKPAH